MLKNNLRKKLNPSQKTPQLTNPTLNNNQKKCKLGKNKTKNPLKLKKNKLIKSYPKKKNRTRK